MLDTELRRVVAARPDQIAVDDLPDIESIGGGRPLDMQFDRRLPLAQADGCFVIERLRHGRDVTQIDLATVPERPDLDISEVARRGPQAETAQLSL